MEAGGNATSGFKLTARDFAWFDTEHQAWIVCPERYDLRLGFSYGASWTVGQVKRNSELILPV
ncbi:fibronectin type III-like domain-contianing protein [Marinovum algicola]|uniref:fibronectin type III-like domain-contianing protein n=1 Tax=Marinovum TaxID=367771 RepID=UPI0032EF415B